MAKYKIIPSSRTIVQSPISIGHKAEKGVEAIEFDLTAWVETYGSGTLTVIMRRWGDAIPYPIALEIDENNKATWTLSDIDTAKAGMAYAQLNYVVGDEVVKKSDIYTFRVMDSLTGEGDPPEAYESWLEQLTHLAAEAMAEVLDIEGIVTDKTLTVDGGIADAKATGDALSALKDAVTEKTDKLKADLDDVTGATRNINTATMGRYNNTNAGNIYEQSSDNYYGMSSFVKIKPNTNYAISCGGISSNSAINTTILLVDTNGNVLSRAGFANNNPRAIETPNTADRIHVFYNSTNAIDIGDNAYCQIEEGTTATAHIKHLSAVDAVGRESIQYVRDSLENKIGYKSQMESGADLDDFTNIGIYKCVSTDVVTYSNYPSRFAGVLIVYSTNTTIVQILIDVSGDMYARFGGSQSWYDWVKYEKTENVEQLADRVNAVETVIDGTMANDGENWGSVQL